jgi:hypothetical protein
MLFGSHSGERFATEDAGASHSYPAFKEVQNIRDKQNYESEHHNTSCTFNIALAAPMSAPSISHFIPIRNQFTVASNKYLHRSYPTLPHAIRLK